MSVVIPTVVPAEDRWPAAVADASDPLDALLLASHLLGANRAIANVGGGNTSAKGVAEDHTGRDGRDDLGQGLGLRSRDDGARRLHRAAAG